MRPISKGARSLRRILSPQQTLTQKQLAEKLGVTQQAVSAWLRGGSRPDHRRMQAIESLLGVSVADWDEPAEVSDDSGEHAAVTDADEPAA